MHECVAIYAINDLSTQNASITSRRGQRRLWLDQHCGVRRLHHLLNGCDRRLGVIAVEGQRHVTRSRDDTMNPNG
jgi:hypothetical protein